MRRYLSYIYVALIVATLPVFGQDTQDEQPKAQSTYAQRDVPRRRRTLTGRHRRGRPPHSIRRLPPPAATGAPASRLGRLL